MFKDFENVMCYICFRNCKNWLYIKFVNYVCCFLGIFNLGLWISSSIGEGCFFVFIILIYKVYEKVVWFVINKIVLFFIIFFWFYIGLDFLEFFWKYENV